MLARSSAAPVRALVVPVERDADDVQLLNQVTNYYHETLQRSPDALAYLPRAASTIPTPSPFQTRLRQPHAGPAPADQAAQGRLAIRTRLERLGVMRESGHEHLAGSLIVPILDDAGNTVNLYGRKLIDNLRAGTASTCICPNATASIRAASGTVTRCWLQRKSSCVKRCLTP